MLSQSDWEIISKTVKKGKKEVKKNLTLLRVLSASSMSQQILGENFLVIHRLFLSYLVIIMSNTDILENLKLSTWSATITPQLQHHIGY